mmetsp:Transcript_7542/g.17248  ORF Transcript_7542/g.17248 Transcript_7542/m.17248 type:complete len:101 (+) Transcript_7542:80-382(+)|eukprot:CAMPEP_0172614898 /NCGR_PEP_ID=MMETSP1068-20121228/55698_1 /TAXON_ID=35684 /ORGANISM="Pseudopedinella elastica, Strain CCMP716" /LENGTH=100 /DNA_ID=CAMNT_0013419851 /DNA_START=80 /DNA_END=382 /DNA_ORIENTATION=-
MFGRALFVWAAFLASFTAAFLAVAPSRRIMTQRQSTLGEAPFSDKLYNDIRVVTQIIAKRAQSDTPVTKDQYAELKAAIESIVNDAHDFYGGGPEGPFKA